MNLVLHFSSSSIKVLSSNPLFLANPRATIGNLRAAISIWHKVALSAFSLRSNRPGVDLSQKDSTPLAGLLTEGDIVQVLLNDDGVTAWKETQETPEKSHKRPRTTTDSSILGNDGNTERSDEIRQHIRHVIQQSQQQNSSFGKQTVRGTAEVNVGPKELAERLIQSTPVQEWTSSDNVVTITEEMDSEESADEIEEINLENPPEISKEEEELENLLKTFSPEERDEITTHFFEDTVGTLTRLQEEHPSLYTFIAKHHEFFASHMLQRHFIRSVTGSIGVDSDLFEELEQLEELDSPEQVTDATLKGQAEHKVEPTDRDISEIQSLIELGFEPSVAEAAYWAHGRSAARAADILFNQQEDSEDDRKEN